jgi:hypothetical protein
MSRWSASYRARHVAAHDTVDTVDTVQPEGSSGGHATALPEDTAHCVNSVNSVRPFVVRTRGSTVPSVAAEEGLPAPCGDAPRVEQHAAESSDHAAFEARTTADGKSRLRRQSPWPPLPADAAGLLRYLRDRGVRLWVEGDAIRVSPTWKVPPKVVMALMAVVNDLRDLLLDEIVE